MPVELKIQLIAGDITKQIAGAIVNSTNKQLDLSKAIADAGGVKLQDAIVQYKKKHPEDMTRNIAVTDAGDLPCSKVLHISLPRWSDAMSENNETTLSEFIEMCLIAANNLGLQSIAFPLLGGGDLGYPLKVVARAFVDTLWIFKTIQEVSCLHLVKILVDICDKEFRQHFAIEMAKHDKSEVYTNDNQIEAVLVSGNLERQSVHALVIPCSAEMEPTCSVAKAVQKAAGDIVSTELRTNFHPPLKNWDFAVTTGGNLEARYIYHVNIPRYSEDILMEDFIQMIDRCMTDAVIMNCKSIAFTLPVTKDLKYPSKLTASCFKRGYCTFQRSHNSLDFFEMRVVVKEKDVATYEAFRQAEFETHSIDFSRVPKTWCPMTREVDVLTCTLSSNCAEYKEVAELLKATASVNYEIKKIERIQNQALYLQYDVKRWQLHQRNNCQPMSSIEKRLWHGTTESAVMSINYHGFNRSYCGRNELRFGEGVYFSQQSKFALDSTYSVRGPTGLKYVYLANVLVGRFTVGDKSMKVPPPIEPDKPHIRYDSTTNSVDNPSLFVIYNDIQAYPQYLLTLK